MREPGKPVSNTVHSRWRGLESYPWSTTRPHAASLPRARAVAGREHVGQADRRVTPAGAGWRTTPVSSRSATAVHSRWRGPRAVTVAAVAADLGSLALSRAEGLDAGQRKGTERFTPAGAGWCGGIRGGVGGPTSHSRWRGLEGPGGGQAPHPRESLPLARAGGFGAPLRRSEVRATPAGAGRGRGDQPSAALHRVTPAGAGWSGRAPRSPATFASHSRWRGLGRCSTLSCSPVAELLLLARAEGFRRRRVTPAGAGWSRSSTPDRSNSASHSRWRGLETQIAPGMRAPFGSLPLAQAGGRWSGWSSKWFGSSPMAPAGADYGLPVSAQIRVTPASVGWRLSRRSGTRSGASHYRCRGTRAFADQHAARGNGSLPLARAGDRDLPLARAGAPQDRHHDRGYRVTPAGAGWRPASDPPPAQCPSHSRGRGLEPTTLSATAVANESLPLARAGDCRL